MGTGIAIIVVNYGSSRLVDVNLAATHSACPEAEVVVVDNFSTLPEREAITEVCARRGWNLVTLERNTGFGGGMNAGVARALSLGASELLLINPDATIDAGSMAALRRAVDGEELVAASPVVEDAAGRTWFAGVDLYLADGTMRNPARRAEFPEAERIGWLSGACLWMRGDVWEAVGGFDEEYFLYWEDVDLSARLLNAGVRLEVVKTARALHDEGATHRSLEQRVEAKSELYYYYNIRNRMLFAARHLGPEGVRAWQRSSWSAAKAILLRGGRRQFLRPVAPLRAAFRGLRDGRRIARAALRGGTAA